MTEPEANLSPAGHHDPDRFDAKMIEAVRAAGRHSDELRLLRDVVLLPQGLGLFNAWYRKGTLFAEVERQLGFSLPSPPDDWPAIAAGLIEEAIRSSVEQFFDNAVFGTGSGRWKPDGGASVKTYFVRQCLYTFADLYRKEHRQRAPGEILRANVHGDDPDAGGDTRQLPVHRRAVDNPESRAVDGDTIRRLRTEMSDHEADIVWKIAAGQTHREIGQDLGMTADAVRSRLRRLRARIGR